MQLKIKCQLRSLTGSYHYEIFWKFSSHYAVMKTALLDCINGNKNITLQSLRKHHHLSVNEITYQHFNDLGFSYIPPGC